MELMHALANQTRKKAHAEPNMSGVEQKRRPRAPRGLAEARSSFFPTRCKRCVRARATGVDWTACRAQSVAVAPRQRRASALRSRDRGLEAGSDSGGALACDAGNDSGVMKTAIKKLRRPTTAAAFIGAW
eukprot:4230632-Prymnesium_polylepis.1